MPSTGGGGADSTRSPPRHGCEALNDVRLAIGTRLDIRDDTVLEDELDDAVLKDPTSARVGQLSLYAYLGLLLESLLYAMTG